jgi:hypothetical protein
VIIVQIVFFLKKGVKKSENGGINGLPVGPETMLSFHSIYPEIYHSFDMILKPSKNQTV